MIELDYRSSTAEVEIPDDGGEGVIRCQGGCLACWSLCMKAGKVSCVHNWVGRELYTITTPESLPPGKATTRYEFGHDGADDQPGSTPGACTAR